MKKRERPTASNYGERQRSTTLDDIRRDHVARYEWVTARLDDKQKIIDAACGVGYGSNIMAKAGHQVTGVDISDDAIEFARLHWSHPRARFVKGDLTRSGDLKPADIAVAFECIEHMEDPRPMLNALRSSAPSLFASVPNEEAFPWHPAILHHHRHYTKGELNTLLGECGWDVVAWYGQEGPESEVEPDVIGRTLIAYCVRGDFKSATVALEPRPKPETVPDHVAILGLGPSLGEYTNITRRLGNRHRYCDETWAINALGGIVQCDKIFHMDDVRIQEIRAKALPESNIAAMLEWMQKSTTPIMTSRPAPGYPSLEAFPLVDVLNEFNTGYFNSTAAYAVAYAIWIGVKKISLFGVDFTYPDAHDAEKGRACVEYWLGMAAERGIRLVVPKTSTLLDALHTQRERFYGYDTLDLRITQDDAGPIKIDFAERADIPTAQEVEEAYNHLKHPNALMSEVKDAV